MDERIARRAWLARMAALGSFGAAGLSGVMSRALAKGDLANAQSLHKVDGSAKINGKAASAGAPIALGDRIETGPGSQAVVVMRGDAFLMRAQTIIEVRSRSGGVMDDLRVNAGKLLSVFSSKPVAISARNATIGIRGTGAYLEVDPGEVYFCLCYGEAVAGAPGMPDRTVKTTHHEQPLLLRDAGGYQPAGFRNHTDDELILLESLVGREPPFMKGGQYPANKY